MWETVERARTENKESAVCPPGFFRHFTYRTGVVEMSARAGGDSLCYIIRSPCGCFEITLGPTCAKCHIAIGKLAGSRYIKEGRCVSRAAHTLEQHA